jgi:hypothetical protein
LCFVCDGVITVAFKAKAQSTTRKIEITMSETITVYEKPTCTVSRDDKFLRERGVDFSKVNYYIEPLIKKN